MHKQSVGTFMRVKLIQIKPKLNLYINSRQKLEMRPSFNKTLSRSAECAEQSHTNYHSQQQKVNSLNQMREYKQNNSLISIYACDQHRRYLNQQKSILIQNLSKIKLEQKKLVAQKRRISNKLLKLTQLRQQKKNQILQAESIKYYRHSQTAQDLTSIILLNHGDQNIVYSNNNKPIIQLQAQQYIASQANEERTSIKKEQNGLQNNQNYRFSMLEKQMQTSEQKVSQNQ